MNRKSKLLSLLLALCILAAVFPALPSAMAADGETAAPPVTAVTYEDVLAGLADPYDYFGPLDENSVPAAVGYENAVERLHVARMYDEEGDSLHNVIFKNADGSRTQYLFDYPVKYVTETGEIADIRLDVVRDAQTAGAFRTAANSVVTTFFAVPLRRYPSAVGRCFAAADPRRRVTRPVRFVGFLRRAGRAAARRRHGRLCRRR